MTASTRFHPEAEFASALGDVPKGRYVLAIEVDAINDGIDAAERGELSDYEEVRRELDEAISRAKAGRAK